VRANRAPNETMNIPLFSGSCPSPAIKIEMRECELGSGVARTQQSGQTEPDIRCRSGERGSGNDICAVVQRIPRGCYNDRDSGSYKLTKKLSAR
jgi:hypothetical protein